MVDKSTVVKGLIWTSAAIGAVYYIKGLAEDYSKAGKVYADFVKDAPARKWELSAHWCAMNHRFYMKGMPPAHRYPIPNFTDRLPPLPRFGPRVPFENWWIQQGNMLQQSVLKDAYGVGLTKSQAMAQMANGTFARVSHRPPAWPITTLLPAMLIGPAGGFGVYMVGRSVDWIAHRSAT